MAEMSFWQEGNLLFEAFAGEIGHEPGLEQEGLQSLALSLSGHTSCGFAGSFAAAPSFPATVALLRLFWHPTAKKRESWELPFGALEPAAESRNPALREASLSSISRAFSLRGPSKRAGKAQGA